MKKVFLAALVLIFTQSTIVAQTKKLNKQKNQTTANAVVASDQSKKEQYLIDRDSAFADPRIAIQTLIGGNKRFVEGTNIRPRQDAKTIKQLENGQQPFAVIVGCSDSRVPNEIVFDQGLGDLFIIRTAGQVSATASYGSMEFATLNLKTKLIVVLGHTECGAVGAAVSRPQNVPGHIVNLINEIKGSVAKCANMSGNPANNAVRQNVIDQVENLRNLEPILGKQYASGEIIIVGAVYDIHTGKVEFLEETLKSLPPTKIK